MFVAHLPAAYLASLPLVDRADPEHRRRLLALGLIAGVAPDLDMLWFFLVDHRRHVHHGYLPHLPAAWAIAFAAAALIMALADAGRAAWLALGVITVNVLLHLVLDTIAGGIEWQWPLSSRELVLTSVPARYHPWFLNFVVHWTFALEIALIVAAGWVWRQRARGRQLVGG